MVKQITAGLVGLGIIGGVGAVSYGDDGTPTVTVDNHGQKSKVTLPLEVNGKTYTCPAGTREKRAPYDVAAGKVLITLRQVRRQEAAIEKRHPGRTAPAAVADRYNALVSREGRLVRAYNRQVDKANAIIDSDCTS
jgi:hypothetical protein